MRWTCIFATAFLAAVLAGPVTTSPQEKERAAVIDLHTQSGIGGQVSRAVSDLLRTHYEKTGQYSVLSRQQMEETLAKKGVNLSDCVTRESIVAAGRVLGVDVVFTGFISKGRDGFYVSIDLYRVDTGEIEPVGLNDCPLCPEDTLIHSLTQAAAAFSRKDETAVETKPAGMQPGPHR